MGRIRFVGILLLPSVGSAFLCTGLSIATLAIASLLYNAHTGFLYTLLFGPDSSVDLIQSARGTFDAIFQTTFSNPVLNKVIFFAFWCLVGLVVYALLSGIGKTTSVIAETAEQMHYLHAKKRQFEEQLGLRVIVYTMTGLLGFLYSIFFFKTLLPFSILCGRIGISALNFSGWLYVMAGTVVLTLSYHIFIVLIRLLLLRPRIYGGWEDVLDDSISSDNHS